MAAAAGERKLAFQVVFASSEDTDYPATELNFHSPQTKGWQSSRCVQGRCTYRVVHTVAATQRNHCRHVVWAQVLRLPARDRHRVRGRRRRGVAAAAAVAPEQDRDPHRAVRGHW